MPNAFIPLREYMQTLSHPENQSGFPEQQLCREQQFCHPEEPAGRLEGAPEITEAVSAARRFSVAVAESVERTVERVLRDIAYEVLGRELLLAPVDINAIVKRLLAETEETSVIRVHTDPKHGDVLLELRDGTLDARFSVRLEHALRTVGAA